MERNTRWIEQRHKKQERSADLTDYADYALDFDATGERNKSFVADTFSFTSGAG
jgi:hypothetical protein